MHGGLSAMGVALCRRGGCVGCSWGCLFGDPGLLW